jgi:hypothetical protein
VLEAKKKKLSLAVVLAIKRINEKKGRVETLKRHAITLFPHLFCFN